MHLAEANNKFTNIPRSDERIPRFASRRMFDTCPVTIATL